MDYKFKVNDRVRRTPFNVTVAKNNAGVYDSADHDIETTTYSARGCIGTVKTLREETTLRLRNRVQNRLCFLCSGTTVPSPTMAQTR